MDDDKILKTLAQLESSGGKNIDHRTIAEGIHEGDSAIGKYALMPNTIKELLGRNKNEPYENLKDLDNQQIKNVLESDIPQGLRPTEDTIEDNMAKKLLQNIKEKQGNNLERTAASWLYGHNITPEKADSLKDTDYVKKFMEEYNKEEVPDNFNKLKSLLKPRI